MFLARKSESYKKPNSLIFGGALIKVPGMQSAVTGLLGQALAAVPVDGLVA